MTLFDPDASVIITTRRSQLEFSHKLTKALFNGFVTSILSLSILTFIDTSASAAVRSAASCSYTDVASAVKAAQEGDTVLIPAGTCSWTKGLSSYCQYESLGYDASFCRSSTNGDTKHITIQGAGIGQTIIIDEISKRSDPPHIIMWDLSPGGLSRITGIEFRAGNYSGVGCGAAGGTIANVLLYGNTNQLRVDHTKFVSRECPMLAIGRLGNGYVRGVLDHNFYDHSNNTVGIYVHHQSWGDRGDYGDNSYAQPDTVGTSESLFFEDSTCYNNKSRQTVGSYCFDGWWGTRFTVRHMKMCASMMGVHGNDSSARSARQVEFYENTFTDSDCVSPWNMGTSYPSPMSMRGGVGVIFNNTIRTTNGAFTSAFNATNYRDAPNGTPMGPTNNMYGICNGSNPYDQNSTNKGYRCIDQVGTGYGQLMDTTAPGGPINTVTGTKSWPNQVAQPTYAWNNTINGAVSNAYATTPNIVVGRDLINGPRPGYTPYTYPHPLTSGSSPNSPPAPPTGLVVQ